MSYLAQNENRLGLLVFLLSFLIYVLTLCPTVFSGDSGELIAAAYTLSVPHPPGYPLFCLAGKLFTFIPIGSIAFRVNLMCAFFASLTVTIVYFIIIQIIKSISPDTSLLNKFLPALSASLIFAYSNTFWAQAVVAEVYVLFLFMLALNLLILIKWTQERENKFLYWFSFLYGAAITCHQLGVFFAPGFLLTILLYEPRIFIKPKTIFIMFCLFILGLCLYLYVPIRAFSNPAINWNKVHDIGGFIKYLLRMQYGDPKDYYSVSRYVLRTYKSILLPNLNSLLRYIGKEFSLIWIVSALGLLILGWKAKRYFLIFLSIFYIAVFRIWMMASISAVDSNLYIGKTYILSGYIIIAIFIGLGFFYLIELSFKHTRILLYFFAVLTVSLVIVTPLLSNYAENDQSRNYIAYDYGRNILDTLDKDAILLGEGDNTLFILAYLTLAEKLRPDVTIYDDIAGDVFKNTPYAIFEYDAEGKDKIISQLLERDKRPVYLNFGNSLAVTTAHKKVLTGIVYKILREKEEIEPYMKENYWLRYKLRGIFDDNMANKDFLMREIISSYYIALGTQIYPKDKFMGISLYQKAAEVSKNTKFIRESIAMEYSFYNMHDEAISIMKEVINSEPSDPEVRSNLGVAYAKAGRYAEAITAWREALELNPNVENAAKYIEKASKLLSSNTAISAIKKDIKGQAIGEGASTDRSKKISNSSALGRD